MSVIGVAMMSVTRLETLMAGGTREANIAFQATEAGLRAGEMRVEGTWYFDDFASVSGFKGMAADEPDFFDAATWAGNNSETVSHAYPELAVAFQPRYVIKHVGDVTDDAGEKQAIAIVGYQQGGGGGVPVTSVFRITARGTSRDGSAETILQSYFGKV
jgi:type IV pilus assembly protein PilX